jgi:radical SAM superfamily enzyme YgiQ (UPF0313 family)
MEENAKISKILLVVPPRTMSATSVKRCPTPLGLAYIAAVLEQKGVNVKILDATVEGYENEIRHGGYITYGLSPDEIKKRIIDFSPDMVGVTCPFSAELKNVLSTCKLVKDTEKEVGKKILVVIGGLHPSLYPKETMGRCDAVDFIVIGEGEYRLPRLIEKLNNKEDYASFDGLAYRDKDKIMVSPAVERIENLDELPFPARHLLPMEKYIKINICLSPYSKKSKVEQILTSRGCPWRCIFCASCNYWGHKFRARSPKNVHDEMKLLVDKYGVQEIQFADDSFTFDQKRAMEMFGLMKDLNVVWAATNGVMVNSITDEMIDAMKACGCYQLTYAVESGNEYVLHKIMKKPTVLGRVKPLVKKAQSVGISVHATFVVGLPGESKEQIMDTFRFASHTGFDSVSIFIAAPIPGSELYDIGVREGYLKGDFFDAADLKTAYLELPNISKEELEMLVKQESTLYVIKYMFTNPIGFLKKYGWFMIRNPSQIPKIFGQAT